MLKYKNVLVGVHFDVDEAGKAKLTVDSTEAVQKAVQLAESEGSTLTFVTAFEAHPTDQSEWESAKTDEDTVVPSVHRAMDKLLADVQAKNVEASWELLFGVAWKELCNKVSTDNHDLLIVGSRKLSGFAKAFLGRTSKRVLHHAPCPVWVARPREGRTYDRIVIATDLSEIGELVLRHGLSLASWNQSEVYVVHAVPNWFEGRWYRAGMARDIVMKQHEEQRVDARKKLGDQLSAIIEDMTLRATPHIRVETGTPEQVVWNTAVDEDADLVVMGIVGRSGMQKYLVGDTAEKLLPELPCSLLAVKPTNFSYSLL